MPRSGTKLLRALLSQHSKISIPQYETEFLPFMVKKLHHFGDLSQIENFHKFYRYITKLPYFRFVSETGQIIREIDWYNSCENFQANSIFESLIKHDIQQDNGLPTIWGDKSPSYIQYLPLLKKLFPHARFVHIIRDVRDYCLSINKTWGKNMYRAAQRWFNDIQTVRNDSCAFSKDYMEIRYEDLLEQPETILSDICRFLDIEFEHSMTHISYAVEKVGDAKGIDKILTTNKNKYISKLDSKTCCKIESLTSSLLDSLGYPIHYSGIPLRSIGKYWMLLYKLSDGFNFIKKTTSSRGKIAFINVLGFYRIKQKGR